VDQPLGRQLAITSKAMRAQVDAVLAPEDASLNTWIVLHHAADTEAPGLSQRELAGMMAIGGPALVRHVDRLEAEGLVERRRDERDRRVTRITVTERGRRRLAELSVTMDELDREARAVLTPTEIRTLERALHKLHVHALQSLGVRATAPLETAPITKAPITAATDITDEDETDVA
jgi:MarR family transcriptional regulator for hemolysin